ncbi:MAG: alanine--tRNA ligase [Gemmataceae bacterium]|nr:alanine--tRNA ligase [Gemmataceae bacterium]
MPTANEIRQQFIDFFCSKHGHTFVPSSPVVPWDDPTLMFANAGMNQFKDVFLGTGTRPYKRAANTQKCIRAGGKHNDLDDVGKDTYHHTFFEMLGNWSFGDYFKREAIRWAWELLTDVWKIDKSRLHVTVFEGDPANGIPRDDEAAGFWESEAGVPKSHIHYGNKKDNFWEMGETGPCGPCTEIHIDLTPDKSGAKLVNAGSPLVMEIWNLVFIQFNRNADQSLTPLPAQHVDTGMGFERVTAVLQGKSSNYDTDVFTPLFTAIRDVTKALPYGGDLNDLQDVAYRVIGDHIRTLTFSIADGAVPSNEKRGYVLRSILRRAVRYGWQQFGMTQPFLHQLVPAVVENFGGAFPELKRDPARVRAVLLDEETSFLRTLSSGLTMFRVAKWRALAATLAAQSGCRVESFRVHSYISAALKGSGRIGGPVADSESKTLVSSNQLEDECAFKLVDSSGLSKEQIHKVNDREFATLRQSCLTEPIIDAKTAFDLHTEQGIFIDITEQMAAEARILVDRAGYDKLFAEFKETSAQGRKKLVVTAVKGELPTTDDDAKYALAAIAGKVVGFVKDNAVIATGSIGPGESVGLLVDRTNFYGEQGGQVGDTGLIRTDTGADFEVEDTQRLGSAILHIGTLSQGRLAVGDTVTLSPTLTRRLDVQRNHTATHLLNLALRDTLGHHVEQKGSLVDDGKTRFDFSHDKALTNDDIRQLEHHVNRSVLEDQPVSAVTMPLGEAKKLPGVRAVFGEKYPDPVRVVLIGPDKVEAASVDDSIEFCGGTHVERTGSIGPFRIISQEAVAKGVRRLTAVTGRAALTDLQDRAVAVDTLAARFQCAASDVLPRVEALHEELARLREQIRKNAVADLAGAVDKLIAESDGKLVAGIIPAAGADANRAQVDRIRSKLGECVVVFGWDDNGKPGLLVGVTDTYVKAGLHAGKIVGAAAALVDGKGGGNPTLAQAGGKNSAKLKEAVEHATRLAREKMS